MGPTVSVCAASTGYKPLIEIKPNVVFRPTIPQQAAGTRIEPAVSVPNATSAISVASATAFPEDDPPGIKSRLNGLTGVPKYSFIPDVATANSVRFVLPTICTFRWRAIAIQAASACAGLCVRRKNSEPAVVMTPLTSILSFTASRSCLLFGSEGGQ